jgi:glycosyltransferase involved in cell wall biosynthesis
VAAYVGTVGYAHGLGTILEAATRLRDVGAEVTFLIVGDGADRKMLEERAADEGLSNVTFLGQRPRKEIPDMIAATDACLVLLKKTDAFKQVIPTKMLEFMAAGRPVILGVDGQAREILTSAGGGIYIEPENVGQLIDALSELRANPDRGISLGRAGRRYILETLSRSKTAQDYLEVLNKVISGT